MKAGVLLAFVVALLAAGIEGKYHRDVGIPTATRIRQQENRRIAGGLSSYNGEHPFFAGLIINLKAGQTSVCGGALLNNYYVVTVAQCWYDGEDEGREMQVVLGTTTLFTGGTRKITNSVNIHPDYDFNTLANDIAMVEIPYVSHRGYIGPIVLPVAFFGTLEGYLAEIIGFGRTSPTGHLSVDSILNDAYVKVMNNTVCKNLYGDRVTNDIMCTSGEGGKGACGGDYGGPLVLRRFSAAYGKDMLVGLVSFTAAKGCDAGYPTGYTRITSYLKWIQSFL